MRRRWMSSVEGHIWALIRLEFTGNTIYELMIGCYVSPKIEHLVRLTRSRMVIKLNHVLMTNNLVSPVACEKAACLLFIVYFVPRRYCVAATFTYRIFVTSRLYRHAQ